MSIIISERFPEVLTKEETIKYCMLAKEGDVEAKNILKTHNLRLVVHRINVRFSNTNVDFEDLVGYGIIGLLKAVETFDVDKKIQFASYAAVCIDNEILLSFRENKKHSKNISIDSFITSSKIPDENSSTYAELLRDEKDFVDDIVKVDSYNEIHEALKILDPLELSIIEMYYGFNGKPMKQSEIAQIYNYNQANISRTLNTARKKLKIYLELIELGKTPAGIPKTLRKRRK
ncbi:MAG: sigma-70 family RNA polymerase sigma factor [Bacilli bacterium]|nr:sigma-70 family RNA polymerase sigma factor [Bacilli bacterium]